MNLLARFFNIIITLIIFAIAGFILIASYGVLTYPDINWSSVVKADMAIIAFAFGIYLAFFGLKSAHEILKDAYGKHKSVKEKEMVN